MRGPIRIPLRAIAIAATTAMLLASCGSSSGKSASGSGSASTTNSAATSTSSSGSGSSPTTVKSFSGSDSGEFCSLVHGRPEVTNPSIPTNPLDWKTTFQNVQKSLNELKAKAPPEIQGDLNTISNAYDQLVTAIDNANGNLATIGSTLESTFTSGNFKTAVTNLRNYLVNVCHLSLPTTPAT